MRNDEARSMREMCPEAVRSLKRRKAKPENSQFCKYALSVINEFFISGRNGNIRTAVPDMKPMRNSVLPRFVVTINKPGRNISGINFIITADAKKKPARRGFVTFSRTRCCLISAGRGCLMSVCFSKSKIVMRKKKMATPSICPEALISITGRGCQA